MQAFKDGTHVGFGNRNARDRAFNTAHALIEGPQVRLGYAKIAHHLVNPANSILKPAQATVNRRKIGLAEAGEGTLEAGNLAAEPLARARLFFTLAVETAQQCVLGLRGLLTVTGQEPPCQQRPEQGGEQEQEEDLEKQEGHDVLFRSAQRPALQGVGSGSLSTRISMRRLRARPLAVALSATGSRAP